MQLVFSMIQVMAPVFRSNDDQATVPANDRPLLSVVVPAYNEAGTIAELIRRVRGVEVEKEIIVVDDGSTDDTGTILKALSEEEAARLAANPDEPVASDHLRIFFQDKNRGKGAALRRGFREARGKIVIIQDADLELDPKEYCKLIEPIEQGKADVVYGSRFLGKAKIDIPFRFRAANRILTVTSNVLSGLRLTDVWTGYKVFRREILESVDLKEDRFGFEPEITAKIARTGCRVTELPVAYTPRSRDDGKKIGWKDAVRGMWCTLRYGMFS